MYLATTRAHNAKMQPLIRNALIPIIYILTDLWTSEVTGDKFIGERVDAKRRESIVAKIFLYRWIAEFIIHRLVSCACD